MNLIDWITDADAATWGIVCMMFGLIQLLDDHSHLPRWFSAFLFCAGIIRVALAIIVGLSIG